jgi:hypothetical protein
MPDADFCSAVRSPYGYLTFAIGNLTPVSLTEKPLAKAGFTYTFLRSFGNE